MGLDAVVYCACHELGRTRTAPPTPTTIGESGALETPATDLELVLRFDQWRIDACEHEDGVLIHRRLGNIATVEFLAERLMRAPGRFPLLLSRVVYSGTHSGDYLDVNLLDRLDHEIISLGALELDDPQEEQLLRNFQEQMRALVRAARSVGKPIVF